MDVRTPKFERYVFVCEHEREDGVCCGPQGGGSIREALKSAVKERRLQGRIRVSRAGCLDVCAEGPNVLVYPSGRWYAHVRVEDVPLILEELVQTMEQRT